ncbi:secretion protein HlyD [Meridianimarinicoccus roseus]|jgi:multidrug resistance efflux pump|uniref:Secretion protein HlyD n=1 Tax=Meridianimarinicoccus roseus TaxID=2072018 RepID=A0A2V2LKY0_9RHOB|nr:biotin/lipoyl-binding protein [Meridianimarinicoccus roseus]PWR03737.1 secretion protein HlyD [Meridianimarinicoccus roseus]
MLELMFCSFFTILPDFLYRRFGQGKRVGREITLFSVWYELRWGLTGCLMLTVLLVTVVFYFHPSTTNVSSFFRTVTILPQIPGRVDEVYVRSLQRVSAGEPLFRVEDSTQRTAVEAARRRITEIDAALAVARDQLVAANGSADQAVGTLEQAQDELARQLNLQARNADIVSGREIDRLQNTVNARQGAVDAAFANVQALQTQIDVLFPAQRATAEAALAQAQAELDKTIVTAGVDGTVEQFQLQVGDYVSSVLRPAGILVPTEFEEGHFVAGFGQLAGQIVKPGMLAEISCASQPFTVVPMVITAVQPVIAAGQFRPTDQLVDLQSRTAAPGTLTVRMEPLYSGQADDIPPGSACVANAYTSFHDRLQDPSLGFWTKLGMHGVDTVGLVHAIILRAQTLLLPVRSLVLSGGH